MSVALEKFALKPDIARSLDLIRDFWQGIKIDGVRGLRYRNLLYATKVRLDQKVACWQLLVDKIWKMFPK